MVVEILTPEKTLFKGDAESVTLPGLVGSLGILNHHANLITPLTKGNVVVRAAGKVETFAVTGGVAEVRDNKLTVLA